MLFWGTSCRAVIRYRAGRDKVLARCTLLRIWLMFVFTEKALTVLILMRGVDVICIAAEIVTAIQIMIAKRGEPAGFCCMHFRFNTWRNSAESNRRFSGDAGDNQNCRP